MEEELPHPWKAVYDPHTKANYYWNVDTDEVSWELPQVKQRTPTKDKAEFVELKLPPQWREVVDEATGYIYFWNTETNEVSWDPPVDTPATNGKAVLTEAKPAPSSAGTEETKQGEGRGRGKREDGKGKKNKRGVIMAESYDIDESFQLKKIPKSLRSKQVILESMERDHGFIFSALSADEKGNVVDAMEERQVAAGEELITQGDTGDNFYVVESGDFDIIVNGTRVATRHAGSSFGERALLYNCPRAATVKATTKAIVWFLDRKTFRHLLANTRESALSSIVRDLRGVTILKNLTDEQLNRIAEAVQMQTFHKGDMIIKKGDMGDSFFMVKSGDVVCTGAGSGGKRMEDLPLKAGAIFGERALLFDTPRAANVIATSDCTCMVLNRKAFNELLGPLHELIDENLCSSVVRTIPTIGQLPDELQRKVAKLFTSRTVPAKSVIVKKGDRCDTLFVIKSGSVSIDLDGRDPITLSEGYFGEGAFSDATVHSNTITATQETQLLVLPVAQYHEFMAQQQKESASTAAPTAVAASTAGSAAPAVAKRPENTFNFSDLEVVAPLGAGTFGKVKLVRHKPSGKPYALKVLQKAKVVEMKQQQNVVNEKNVMMMVNHPFVLKCEATFKDKNNLYMLLEVVQGGELFNLLANTPDGFLETPQARFYAACVVSGLGALHEKQIVYRDLKPENMLLDSEGYIKLVDMGFAKIVKDRTYTLCGTPEYLAPEIVMGKGHNKGVDYWAVGILIFEMLCGYSPFSADSGDQMEICTNILQMDLVFPSDLDDKYAKDIVKRLLNRDPLQRLGCRRDGIKEIIKHAWFKKIDWKKLVAKAISAPWKPPLKDPFDTRHFDPEQEEDDDSVPYRDDGSGWDADF